MYAQHIWRRLKSITADEIIAARKREGYMQDPAGKDASIAFIKPGTPNKRVVIHYHPRRTDGSKLLKAWRADTGPSEADMRRLKLIK